ncbi:MAG: DKNYY domain-containing protein [Candidatus Paceibacterota bacterium]
MNTTNKLLLLILTVLIMTSCRHGYQVEDDKVYYEYWNEGSGQNKRLLEQADANSFEPISFDCDCSFEFGRDKNHLFINGTIIENIDPLTFDFLGNYIFRDKDSAYFFGFYNYLNNCAISGIDPDKIELIEYPWAKANKTLLNGGDTLFLEDIDSFKPLDKDWGKTNNYIIYKNKIVLGADVESFEILNSYTGKDNRFKYEWGEISEENWTTASFSNYDFNLSDFSTIPPTEFTDIYDQELAYKKEESTELEIVKVLTAKGFEIQNITQRKSGEHFVISVTLSNISCNCYVDKQYKFNYSTQSDLFEVTERIQCRKKK